MTESLAFDHEAKPQPLRRGNYKLYFHYTDTVILIYFEYYICCRPRCLK
jgi:hypothetical protein